MTYLEAITLSTKLWIWLFKNPGKWKFHIHSPWNNELLFMIGACPLCQYNFKIKNNDQCKGNCILYIKKECGGIDTNKDYITNTAYMKCGQNTRKSATARIAAILRREYEHLTGDKKTFRRK